MTGLPNLTVGDVAWIDDREHKFEGMVRLSAGRTDPPDAIKFVDVLNNDSRVLTLGEFEEIYGACRVVFPKTYERPGDAPPDENAPDFLKRRVRQRYLEAYDAEPTTRSDRALRQFALATAPSIGVVHTLPSPGTLRRWIKHRGATGDRRLRFMGDRTRRGERPTNIHSLAKTVLAEAAQQFWGNVRVTPAQVYHATTDALNKKNKERLAEGLPPIAPPSRATVWRFVTRHSDYDHSRLRLGDRVAKDRFKAIKGSMQASRILETAIIDHTVLDCMVVDEETLMNVGRPYLTLMIDACSRYPLGFYLSFEPPSVLSAMACVRRAVRPKTDIKAMYPDILGEWEAYGVPGTIVADNAWEFANLTTYEYDGFDRLSKVRYPSPTCCTSSTTDYEEYGYDPANNRTSWRRRNGATVTFTYDALNRAQNGLRGEAYAYDNLGRRTLATYAGGSGLVTYDALGRVKTETTNGRTLTYGYDLAGRRIQMTWPDNVFVTYDYDGAGQMKNIWQSDGTRVWAIAYDNLGRRVYGWSGPGSPATQTSYAYDAASRLSAFSHDLAGTAQDQTWTFAYNAAGQVKTRTAGNSLYEWSGVQASKGYTVNGLNQYATVAGAAIGYDLRGNLRSDGARTYCYGDLLNNLSGVWSGAIDCAAPPANSLASLSYEPTGRLWQVTAGATTTNLLYSGPDLVAEYDAAGTLLRRYVPGPGTDEPMVWYEGAGVSNRRFLLADPQGSIVAVTNSAGTSLATNTYDEYGVPAAGNLGRFQYTGQAWIPEVGLYHYKARAYSPTLGRFLQTDPIGYGDGLNWYAYVGNDPMNRSDPDGKQAITPLDLLVGTVHGSNTTVQASASLDTYVGLGGTSSVGVYVGRGAAGDVRVGVSTTLGVGVGKDVSGSVGVTAYGGNTSNVAGASTQVQGSLSAMGDVSVTAGTTASDHRSVGGGVPFVGAAVGASPLPGPSLTASRTETVTRDTSVRMSPAAAVISLGVSATLKLADSIVNKIVN